MCSFFELQTPKDVSLSKSLSWLLRHGAIDEGLQVSDDGFIKLEDVLAHRLFARRCSPTDIRRVVNLSKNRFTLRANPVTGIYEIRANSGHTFKVSFTILPFLGLQLRSIPEEGQIGIFHHLQKWI
jgi:RNA:NAD 2'-phosphotransferase (TPT1/KptA family)